MSSNRTGEIFCLTTFGESHGAAIGGIIEGCPAGVSVDTAAIQQWLNRRRPGISVLTSPRKEDDQVDFLSGIKDGKTLGTPIGFIIRNKDARPADYDQTANAFRPSHADFTWQQKFGIRDHRGGGRSSARETACRVAGGAVAMQLLQQSGISVVAWVSSVGTISMDDDGTIPTDAQVFANEVRCPHSATASGMHEAIESAKTSGDTLGGIVSCAVTGVPPGLGEPVFDKLHACLGKAMLSINAVKGFEIGSGFAGTRLRGSEHNDLFAKEQERIRTVTNRSGGIQGGISNGEDIRFRVAFKPVATLMRDQQGIDNLGNPVVLQAKGRHDPCVLPRAVPVVAAMAALTMADHLLRNRLSKF
jgi:chorismate synthase